MNKLTKNIFENLKINTNPMLFGGREIIAKYTICSVASVDSNDELTPELTLELKHFLASEIEKLITDLQNSDETLKAEET